VTVRRYPVLMFLFAHGAGAPPDSPFMNRVAAGLEELGIRVVRFEFPYMAARRQGKRRPPDRELVLRSRWLEIIGEHRAEKPLFIGGKSMGGRIASLIADEAEVDGLVCFGYPFHPPGKPHILRTAHLGGLATPALIIQGTRDALGSHEEVSRLQLSSSIRIEWIEDGDHSLKPRRSSGRSEDETLGEAVRLAAGFMTGGNST
jgi:uncharacterized protein